MRKSLYKRIRKNKNMIKFKKPKGNHKLEKKNRKKKNIIKKIFIKKKTKIFSFLNE
ncbi:hypothetical protein ACWNYO_00470 [Candidatus Vidania fulgoroideorum]